MINIYVGKKFMRYTEKQNHYLAFQHGTNEHLIELHYTEEVQPFIGGTIDDDVAIQLRDWLNKQFPVDLILV